MPGNNNVVNDLEKHRNEFKRKIEELRAANDVAGLADEFYLAFYDYSATASGEAADPVAEMKTEVLKSFMDTLTDYVKPDPAQNNADVNAPAQAPQNNVNNVRVADEEYFEVKPENTQFLLEFLQEVNGRLRDTIVETGKKIDEWDRKIRNGEVPHTELIKDEPKKTRKIAHAIVMETEIEANSAAEVQRVIFEKLRGRNINGVKARTVYISLDEAGKIQAQGKYGLSEKKLKDYEKLFVDRNPNKSLGFKVNINGTKEGQELFTRIPEYLETFSTLNSKEQIEERERELYKPVDAYDQYTGYVKSVVKTAKKLLAELDSLNEGNEIGFENEFTRKYLEKLTHLGTDYKYEKNAETDIIGYLNVSDAVKSLSEPSEDFMNAANEELQDHIDNGTENTPEGQHAKKKAEVAENIYQLRKVLHLRNEEYNKLGINPSHSEIACNELFYLRKHKKNKGFVSGEPGEDDFTKKIDEFAEAINDSIVNDCIYDKCYDDLFKSLKEYKRIYQDMKNAEKSGNMDEFDRFNTLLADKKQHTKELITACKTFEQGDINKVNIDKSMQSRAKLYDKIDKGVSRTFNRPEKNYESYIYYHVGQYSGATENEKRENMTKVLAAYSLQKMGKKFSVKEIHKAAEYIKELYLLDNDNAYVRGQDRLNRILANKESVLEEGEKLRKELYDIKNDKYDDYVKDMKTLKDSLRSDSLRSTEYKNLVKIIKQASELGEKTKNMSAEDKARAFRQTNIDVIYAVQKYVKGKEKERISDKGNDAFKNSMDALSIVSKYTKTGNPQMNIRVKDVVASINEIRKDDTLSDFTTFENRFGAARAKTAADERRARQNGNNAQHNAAHDVNNNANNNVNRASKGPNAGK